MPELNPDGTVNLDPDPPEPTRYDPAAIANCHRCDSDGYRDRLVCDHRDHEVTTGRAAVQAALAEIRHRKVAEAKRPDRCGACGHRAHDDHECGDPITATYRDDVGVFAAPSGITRTVIEDVCHCGSDMDSDRPSATETGEQASGDHPDAAGGVR